MKFRREIDGKIVYYSKHDLEILFLDYFNNYLSVERFAEHNLLTKIEAENLIALGRNINNEK